MADSNITKRALATALRELMEEVPFDKIQVAHICERRNMNRKSFYYHFKDKYDLLNWIFDTEIISFAQKYADAEQFALRVEMLQEVCRYFYENRSFYRKALSIEGQNSFSEHYAEYIAPIVKLRIAYLIGGEADDAFILNFFTDACVCTIKRWLLEKDCMPPEQFVAKILDIVRVCAAVLHKET